MATKAITGRETLIDSVERSDGWQHSVDDLLERYGMDSREGDHEIEYSLAIYERIRVAVRVATERLEPEQYVRNHA